ncbi:hypothetical protein F4802DRAFT_592731 [Xylaria palmicola]|nr:hypothetical protein F4802DRAFT_592731 [Xylaria palmicola]
MNSSLLDQPALDPPLGVVPDFVHTGGNHNFGYGLIIATSVISTLAVLARLVSSISLRKFLIEDVLLVAALGVFAGNQYITYDLSIYPGFWTHQWNIQNRFLPHFLYLKMVIDPIKNVHLGAVFYGPASLLIKVSILVNWLRIFVPKGTRGPTFWILHTLLWTNVLFYFITTVTEIVRCYPREKIWDPFFEGGSCTINVEDQNIATSIINFVSDSTILAAPQWVIWKLQMSRSRKWGLSLLFVIGIGAWVFGVVRLAYFIKLLWSEDATYLFSGIALYTILELTTGFLIMGIPAFPRAAKMLPMSDSVASFFQSLWSKSGLSNTQVSTPQWQFYKPKSRRRRGLWEITDMETHDMISVTETGVSGSNTNQVSTTRGGHESDDATKTHTSTRTQTV